MIERSQGKKKEKRKYPDKTTDSRDKLIVFSADRKETFTNYIEKNHIGILYSLLSSDKSALGEYFQDYYDGLYINLGSILCEGEEIKRKYFDAFWINKIGMILAIAQRKSTCLLTRYNSYMVIMLNIFSRE